MPARGRAATSPRRAPSPSVNLFDAVRDQHRTPSATPAGACSIAAYSAGSAERLEHRAARARRRRAARRSSAGQRFRAHRRRGAVGLAVLAIEHGYRFDDAALVTEQDILGDRLARPPRRRANYDDFIAEVAALVAGRSRRPCRARHRPL